MRRVVITGIGLVTPLGGDSKTSWANIIEGKSGIAHIDRFDVSDLPAKIAGLVPHGDSSEGKFNPDDWLEPKEQRKVDRFIVYGIAAASQAIEDSGWKPQDEESSYRTGVMIGSGIGGLPNIYETSVLLHTQGPRKISPFFIPSCLINLTSGHVSIKYGFKGPNHSAVTACSTGAHAIGDAARLIQCGDADVMVAGGTEAAVCRLGVAGFAAARSLSTQYNETPEQASRPWDDSRDGFVMGEGAGIVVLEELEHALKRGAKIYAEYKGSGLTGDAFHITSPSGDGAYRAMVNAMKSAKLNPEDFQYINAHGTSTPAGDIKEVEAAKKAFGAHAKKVAMSSTKSAIGHLLGAAGGVECVFSILSIRDNILPPTLNLNNPSEGCDMDFVPHEARQAKVENVLCNSFGFGGTNVSVAFSRFNK
ncbi:MAG: beta-ketoacyl-ACP synthase II [Alphaproteobacteria bacterium]|nr:beta-ketoacyl-ACP synthase II [Alphaproteobacteria bacterium]